MRIKRLALLAAVVVAVSCVTVAPAVAYISTGTVSTSVNDGVAAGADTPSTFTFSLTGPTPGPLTTALQLGCVGVFALSLLCRDRFRKTIRKGTKQTRTSVTSTYRIAYSANNGRFSHWTARTSMAGTSAF